MSGECNTCMHACMHIQPANEPAQGESDVKKRRNGDGRKTKRWGERRIERRTSSKLVLAQLLLNALKRNHTSRPHARWCLTALGVLLTRMLLY